MPLCGCSNKDGTICKRRVAPCWQHSRKGVWQRVVGNQTLSFLIAIGSLVSSNTLWASRLILNLQAAPITKSMLESLRG
jgi:hypothetical protein